jgi:hypothetical protein
VDDEHLHIRDEGPSGDRLLELELQLWAEDVDVAELIRARVQQEVRAHNAAPQPWFAGLVAPTEQQERIDAGLTPRRIDAERQTEVACAAFASGQVLILVDDRHVTELDERVLLRSGSTVTFVRLVPLVGG